MNTTQTPVNPIDLLTQSEREQLMLDVERAKQQARKAGQDVLPSDVMAYMVREARRMISMRGLE